MRFAKTLFVLISLIGFIGHVTLADAAFVEVDLDQIDKVQGMLDVTAFITIQHTPITDVDYIKLILRDEQGQQTFDTLLLEDLQGCTAGDPRTDEAANTCTREVIVQDIPGCFKKNDFIAEVHHGASFSFSEPVNPQEPDSTNAESDPSDPVPMLEQWTNQNVTVTILATDKNDCGKPGEVETVTYEIDGVETEVDGAQASFMLSSEGEHDITYHAKDKKGNRGPDKSFKVRIDKTAPTISCGTVTGTPGNNGWWRSAVSIAASANDGASGFDVAETKNKNLTAKMITGEGRNKKAKFGDASDLVSDFAGNTASEADCGDEVSGEGLNIDYTAPTIICGAPIGDLGDNGWYTSTVELAANFTDNISGFDELGTLEVVSEITYVTEEGAEVVITFGGGSEVLYDYAGNVAIATDCSEINIDFTAPTIVCGAYTGTTGNNGWYTSEVEVDAVVTDNVAGFDASGAKNKGLAKKTISAQGRNKKATFGGPGEEETDYAGNVAYVEDCSEINIDFTAPTIICFTADGTLGDNGWYISGVTLSAEADDGISGFDAAGTTTAALADQVITTEGTNLEATFGDGVEDYAGNTASSSSCGNVNIDFTGPTIICGDPDGTLGENGWYTSAVEFDATANDSTSGFDGVGNGQKNLAKKNVNSQGRGKGVTFSDSGDEVKDDAGNTADATSCGNVNIDFTGPTIICGAPLGTLGDNGWYLSDVTVDASGSDSVSGFDALGTTDTTLAAQTIGTEGTDQTTSFGDTGNLFEDYAGNIAQLTECGNVNIDFTGPTIICNIVQGVEGDNGWYRSAVTVDANANDGTSGFDSGGTPVRYINPKAINSPGQQKKVNFGGAGEEVYDYAGNLAQETSCGNVNIDFTGPTITCNIVTGTTGDNGWYTSAVTVGATADDDVSGFDATNTLNSSLSDQTITTEGAALDATFGDAGNEVTDFAGNPAGPISCGNVNIDFTGPTITCNIVQGVEGNNGWYTSAVTVGAEADDNVSGFDPQHGDKHKDLPTKALTAPGHNKIAVFGGSGDEVIDVAGNVAQYAECGNVDIDFTGPTITCNIVQGALGENGWYTSAVTAGATATDDVSGFDGASTLDSSLTDQQITTEGLAQDATFGDAGSEVEDYAGNTAAAVTCGNVNIDFTGPTITCNIVQGVIGNNDWYTSPVDVSADADDNLSGFDAQGSTNTSLPNKSINSQGRGKKATFGDVGEEVTDYAGNISQSVDCGNVDIDFTGPTITCDIVQLPANANDWYNTAVSVSATATDDVSGFDALGGLLEALPGQDITTEGVNQTAQFGDLGDEIEDFAGNAAGAVVCGNVDIDFTGPTITCNIVQGVIGDHNWYVGDVTLGADADDNLSGFDELGTTNQSLADKILSSQGSGQNATFGGSGEEVIDQAGNIAQSTECGNVDIDFTGPTITCNITQGTLGDNGWYTSAVDVGATAEDDLSGFDAGGSLTQALPDETLSTEGQDQSVSFSDLGDELKDYAGNIAPVAVCGNVNIDFTGPTIVCNIEQGIIGNNNWYISDVTVSATADDSTSGFDDQGSASTSLADKIIASQGTGLGAEFGGAGEEVVDYAGNIAQSTSCGNVDIDFTGPTITCNITQGDLGLNGWYTSAVSVDGTAEDDLSGFDAQGTLSQSLPEEQFATEGQNQSATYGDAGQEVQDFAGNVAPVAVCGNVDIDFTGPTIICNIAQGIQGNNNWYIAGVTLDATAEDQVSGFDNQGTKDQALQSKSIDSQGRGQSVAFSGAGEEVSDYAGNLAQETECGNVDIDFTGPTITCNIEQGIIGQNGWYNSGVTLGADATDDLSGFDALGTLSNVLPEQDLLTEGLDQGLAFGSGVEDYAGNAAQVAICGNVDIDFTGPTIICNINQGVVGNNNWYISTVTVGANAEDDLSGFDDQGTSSQSLSDKELNSQGQGQSASFGGSGEQVTDYAGNIAQSTSCGNVDIDFTGPTITCNILQGIIGNNGWYVSAVDVGATAEDDLSGFDDQGTLSEDLGAQQLTGQGTDQGVTFGDGVSDYAGNVSQTAICGNVDIDFTGPTIICNINQGIIGDNNWYISAVTLGATAEDDLSGFDAQGSLSQGLSDEQLNSEGRGLSATFGDSGSEVSDYAGNIAQSAECGNVDIDFTGPTITCNIEQGIIGNNGWYVSAVAVGATADDDLSGFDALGTTSQALPSEQLDSEGTGQGASFGDAGDEVKDYAGNVAQTAVCGNVNIDFTGPTIICSINQGIVGNNNWYISSVNIGADADDNLSGFDAQGTTNKQLEDQELTSEGRGQSAAFGDAGNEVSDYAGNLAQSTECGNVDIDFTGPTITCNINQGIIGQNGWYVSAVDVDATANDDLSGFDAQGTTSQALPSEQLSTEGTGQSAEFGDAGNEVEDHAGNVAQTAVCGNVDIDFTGPTIVCSINQGVVGNNNWYISEVSIGADASDNLSGFDALGSLDLQLVEKLLSNQGSGQSATFGDAGDEVSDYAGNIAQTTSCGNVDIDFTGPTITCNINQGILGQNGWYLSGVDVGASASDDLSGFDADGTLSQDLADQQLGDEGRNQSASFGDGVEDYAGNASQTAVCGNVDIDFTGPTIICDINQGIVGDNNWYISSVTVGANASDDLSGFDGLGTNSQSLGGQDLTSQGRNQSVEFGGAGNEVADYAGNIAQTTSCGNVDIDFTGPTITCNINQGILGQNGWYVSAVDVAGTAIDDLSGFDAQGTLNSDLPEAQFTEEGLNQSATYGDTGSEVSDFAGNVAQAAVCGNVNIDFTGPTIICSIAQGVQGNNNWYISQVEIAANAEDTISGFDDQGSQNKLLENKSLTEQGQGLSALYSDTGNEVADYAGNIAQTTECGNVDIDFTGPTITCNIAQGIVGKNGWFVSVVDLGASANDDLSGFDASGTLNEDLADQQLASEGFNQGATFGDAGNEVSDYAGNAAQTTVCGNVDIDFTGPTIICDIAQGIVGDNNWFISDVTIGADASDNLSGFDGLGSKNTNLDAQTLDTQGLGLSASFGGAGDEVEDYAGNIAQTAECGNVNIDFTGPTITCNILQGIIGQNGWYVSAVDVGASATDDVSGFDDQGSLSTDLANQQLDSEGTGQTATFGDSGSEVKDYAGNAAQTSVCGNVDIDFTGPTIICDITQGVLGNNNWFISDVTIGASALDDVSGFDDLAASTKALADQAIASQGRNQSVEFGTAGAEVSDYAGNIAQSTSCGNVDIDFTGPTITCNIAQGIIGNNGWYVSGVTVGADAEDDLSGFDNLGTASQALADQQLTSEGLGLNATFGDGVADHAGNAAQTAVCGNVDIDFTGPTIICSVNQGIVGDNNWYISEVTVAANANDNLSGFDDLGTTTQQLANSILDSQGRGQTATFGDTGAEVEDYAGNIAQSAECGNVDIDFTGPTITCNIAQGVVGQNGWYVSGVMLNADAADDVSGFDAQGSLSQALPEQEIASEGFAQSATFGAAGNEVEDYAGNVAQTAVCGNVDIDFTGPTIICTINQGVVGNNNWYISEVNIGAEASDNLSGFDGLGQKNTQLATQLVDTQGRSQTASFGDAGDEVSDYAGNIAQTTECGNVDIDFTGPTITCNIVQGTLGQNGWYVSGVALGATATDLLSGFDSLGSDSLALAEQQIASEGTGLNGEFGDGVADYAGNVAQTTVCGNVDIDFTGPTIICEINQGVVGDNNWYISEVTLNATAQDALSGFDDQGAGSTALASKLLSGQGLAQSETFGGAGEEVSDYAGNIAQSASCGNVNIDFTGPTITCNIAQGVAGKNGWYVSPVAVVGSAQDDLSGFDAQGALSQDLPEAQFNDEGLNQSATYGAAGSEVADYAGNVAQTAVCGNVDIDFTGPTILCSINQGVLGNNNWYISDVTIAASAEDTVSGFDNQGSSSAALADKLISGQGRGQNVTYGGLGEEIEDYAGNIAQSAECGNVDIDFTGPTITCNIEQGTLGKNGWYTSAVAIGALAEDDLSGFDAQGALTESLQEQLLAAEGQALTSAFGAAGDEVEDFAGNVAQTAVCGNVNIDFTGPTILCDINQGIVGNNNWYISNVTVGANASDNLAGFDADGSLASALAEKSIATQGRGLTAEFGGAGEQVEDYAGNIAQSASCGNVDIDFTGPTITCNIVQGSLGNNGWYTSAVGLGATANDELSGFDAEATLSQDLAEQQVAVEGFGQSATFGAGVEDHAGNLAQTAVCGNVNIDFTGPTIICNIAQGVVGDNNWYISNVSVGADTFDNLSGFDAQGALSGSLAEKLLTSQGRAQSAAFGSAGEEVADYAGNIAQSAECGNVDIDFTGPTITCNINQGNLGKNGWFTSSVMVSADASDDLSGFDALGSLSQGLAEQEIASEGSGQGVAFGDAGSEVKDFAGNVAQTAVCGNVNIDFTGPTIICNISQGVLGNNNWYISDVVIGSEATDNLAGFDELGTTNTQLADQTLSNQGRAQTATVGGTGAEVEDYAGNIAQSAECGNVDIDFTGPTITCNIVQGLLGNNGWYNSAVMVDAEATDNLAGFDASGTLDQTLAEQELASEGRSQSATFGAGLEDHAGNVAQTAVCGNVDIDFTGPTIVCTINQGVLGNNNWFISSVSIGAEANDNLSGFDPLGSTNSALTEKLIDAQGRGQTAAFGGSGEEVSDYAGNIAQSTSCGNVDIDFTGPTITCNILQGVVGNNGWYTSPVSVAGSAADDLSGFDALGSLSADLPQQQFNDEGMDQAFTFGDSGAEVEDYAGNVAQSATCGNVNIDFTGPTIVCDITQGVVGNNNWYVSAVSLSASASDNLAGFDAQGSAALALAEKTLNNQGTGLGATFGGSGEEVADYAGNIAQSASCGNVNIDFTGPTITCNIAQGVLGNNGWYTGAVALGATAADDLSGFDAQGELSKSLAEQQLSSEGRGQTAAFGENTEDYAGNVAQTAVCGNVDIDFTGPTILCSIDQGVLGNNNWYVSSVSVSATAEDNLAGFDALGDLSQALPGQDLTAQGRAQSATFGAGIEDYAGNIAQTADCGNVDIDFTGPTITCNIDQGLLGNNGWYVSDVTVGASASDNLAGFDALGSKNTQLQDKTIDAQGKDLVVSYGDDGSEVADYAGNVAQTAVCGNVDIDFTGPTVVCDIEQGVVGNNNWYISTVNVGATASDNLAGFDAGGALSQTLAEQQLSEGLAQSATFGAGLADYAGNIAQTANCGNVNIDFTGPTVTCDIVQGMLGNNGWYNSAVNVGATAHDNLSGFDTEDGLSKALALAQLGEGQAQSATFGSAVEDLAGNASQTAVCGNVNIDFTGPTVVCDIEQGVVGNNNWYISTVNLGATASDNLAGFDADGALSQTLAAQQLNEGLGQSATFGAGLEDYAGNIAQSASCGNVNIDFTGPTVTCDIAQGLAGKNGWFASAVTLGATADDNLSGFDANGSLSQSLAEQQLASEGTGLTTSFGDGLTDYAGNAAQTAVCGNVDIDFTGPTVICDVAQGAVGSNNWYISTVSIGASASDNLSGFDASGTLSETLAGQQLGEGRGQSATFGAGLEDYAGNISQTASCGNVDIDFTGPTIGCNVVQGIAGNNGWFTSAVTVASQATDNLSGFDASGTLSQTFEEQQINEEGRDVTLTIGDVDDEVADYAGNAAQAAVCGNVNIDFTGPTVVCDLAQGTLGNNNWYVSAVSVGASASDNLAGFDAQGSLSQTLAEQQISDQGRDLTVAFANVEDHAGNVAQTAVCGNVNIDFTGPTIVCGITQGTEGNNGWFLSAVNVGATANDDLSGFDAQGAVSQSLNEQQISEEGRDLTTTFASVSDHAGNTSQTAVCGNVDIDFTLPTIVCDVVQGTLGKNNWFVSAVSLGATANDDLSGFDAQGSLSQTLSQQQLESEGRGLTSAFGTAGSEVADYAGNIAQNAVCGNVDIDFTGPTIVCDLTQGTEGNNGWFLGAVTLGASASDNLAGFDDASAASRTLAEQILTAEGRALTASFDTEDFAGNSAQTAVCGNVDIDFTAPTITCGVVSGPEGNNSWFLGDVSIEATSADNLSGLNSNGDLSELLAQSFGEEGQGLSATFDGVEDQAGNTADAQACGNFGIDKTDPVISGLRLTDPNAMGWNNTAVDLSFDCTDELSGVSGISALGDSANADSLTTTLSSEGANQSVEGTCEDLAGRTASAILADINIDLGAPLLEILSGLPGNSDNGFWTNQDVLVEWICRDGSGSLSGVMDESMNETLTAEGANQSVTATCKDEAGNTITETLGGINIDKTAPTFNACGAANGEAGLNSWFLGNVSVDVDAEDNLAGFDAGELLSTLTRNTSGEGSGLNVLFDITDRAGNVAQQLSCGPFDVDKSEPVLTFDRTAPNEFGWNNIDVSVTFSCTDGVSGVSQIATTETTVSLDELTLTVTTEGANQERSATCSDVSGRTFEVGLSGINIDFTAPAYKEPKAAPGANEHGWNNTAVRVTFPCADELSGAQEGEMVKTISKEGTDLSMSAGAQECLDLAGNVSEDGSSFGGVNIDRTAPIVNLNSELNDSNIFELGCAPTVDYSVEDELSGVANEEFASTSESGSGAGKNFVKILVTDFADNEALVFAEYSLIYDFSGFFAPLNTDGIYTRGDVIPVRFQLNDCDDAPVVNAIANISVEKISDDVGKGIEQQGATGSPDSGDLFQLRTIDDGSGPRQVWEYMLGTNMFDSGKYQIIVTLDDGTVQTAGFGLLEE
jgi:hypothetical protein